MKLVCLLLVLLVSVACAAPDWGSDGHQITASIAQSFLTSSAASAVSSILNGQSLSSVSTWADEVKSKPAYHWSAVLHYINTPDWACNYQYNRDCAGGICVSGALKNYTSRLSDSSLPSDQIAEALKFIVHFAGDIHQPLHVGFTSDEGGNTIKGTFEGASDNLHFIWDVPLVQSRVQDQSGSDSKYVSYIVQQLQGPWHPQAATWAACPAGELVCPDDWASETVLLACSNAYVDQNNVQIQNGFNLGTPYYQFNKNVIDMQLAKGGVRLAAILNRVFSSSTDLARNDFFSERAELVQAAADAQEFFASNRAQLDDVIAAQQ